MQLELFRPNNLSTIRPNYTHTCDSKVRDGVVAAMAFFLPLENAIAIDVSLLVEEGSFATKFRIGLGERYYFLKCRLLSEEPEILSNEANKAVFFRQNNVPVPELISARSGNHAVETCDRSWILYHFVDGNHFTGRGRELEKAAEGFGRLSLVARDFGIVSKDEIARSTIDANELSVLLKNSAKRGLADQKMAALLSEHRKFIEVHLEEVVRERKIVEAKYSFTHADYHPMNLLLKEGNLVCILDFEDLKVYPLLSALGFGAYKLIRQMLVNNGPEEVKVLSPGLVNCWIDGWRRSFSHDKVTAHELAVGAKYRVLESIRVILHNYLQRGDSRCNYDLAKQIGSLFEIDKIFEQNCC